MNDLPLIERLRDALAKVLPHYVSSAGWSDSDTRMFNSTLAEATARLAIGSAPCCCLECGAEAGEPCTEDCQSTPPAEAAQKGWAEYEADYEAAQVGDLPELPEPVFHSAARGGLMREDGYTADQMHAYARAAIAALRQPSRDREADRQRFPDAGFNRWLDEGISDAGHTVYDATPDLACAWAGWTAREYYGAHPAPSADVGQLVAKWREFAAKLDVRDSDHGNGMLRCADELESALAQPQQASGQAVAEVVMAGRHKVLAWHRYYDGPPVPVGTKLYRAAPALPEVSEVQVEAALDAMDREFAADRRELGVEDLALAARGVRAALESYRASLTGEVKP